MSSENSPNSADFPEALRLIVGKKRGDPARFARRLGIPLQTLLNYLTGRTHPRYEFLRLLAEAGFDVSALLLGRASGLMVDQRQSPENAIEDELAAEAACLLAKAPPNVKRGFLQLLRAVTEGTAPANGEG